MYVYCEGTMAWDRHRLHIRVLTFPVDLVDMGADIFFCSLMQLIALANQVRPTLVEDLLEFCFSLCVVYLAFVRDDSLHLLRTNAVILVYKLLLMPTIL